MMQYNHFMTDYVVRFKNDVKKPKLHQLDKLILPTYSLIHFIPSDSTTLGIGRRDDLLTAYEGKVFSNDVETIKGKQGRYRVVVSGFKTRMAKYYRGNIGIRRTKNIARVEKEPKTMIVNNYSPLVATYRYRTESFSPYYEWSNRIETLIDMAAKSERHQFYQLHTPKEMPEYLTLRSVATRGLDKESLKKLKDSASLDLVMLLAACIPSNISVKDGKTNIKQPASGHVVVNRLRTLPEAVASRIHFVLCEGGKWSCFNLQMLLAWSLDDEMVAKGIYDAFNKFVALRNVEEAAQAEDTEDEDFVVDDVTEEIKINVPVANDAGDAALKGAVKEMSDAGRLTTAAYNNKIKLTEKHKKIPSFIEGDARTLSEMADLEKIDYKINRKDVRDIPGVVDKSMLGTATRQLNTEYIDKVMDSHVAANILAIQNSEIAVTDFKRTLVADAIDKYYLYKVQLTPLNGKPTTSTIQVPVVESDGTWKAGGVKYRTSKVRGEFPIVKVKPDRVAITTEAKKVFVVRNNKVTYNLGKFILRNLDLKAEDRKDDGVTDLKYGNVFNHYVELPPYYTAISVKYRGFTSNGVKFKFDYAKLEENYPEWYNGGVLRPEVGLGELAPVAKKGNWIYAVDKRGTLSRHTKEGYEEIGDMLEWIGIDCRRKPHSVAMMNILGKEIPMVLCLGYLMGLENLLKKLNVKYELVEGRGSVGDDTGFTFNFKHSKLWISDSSALGNIVVAGLKDIRNYSRNYEFDEFNREAVYYPVFENMNLSKRHLDELVTQRNLLLDPATINILKEENLPTKYIAVMLYSAKLLTVDKHLDEKSQAALRIRGYERFPTAIYREIYKLGAQYQRGSKSANTAVQLHPKAVWNTIVSDAAAAIVEDNNPLHNMKEQSLVTFNGFDGRDGQTMPWEMRKFHESEIGVYSEASPDSGKVGTTNYMPMNANVVDLYGRSAIYTGDGTESAMLLSPVTSALVASFQDDTKRGNFGSIQGSAREAAVGYEVMPLLTGMEIAMAHHVDRLWAFPAKQDGKVTKKGEKYVAVEYSDGTVDTCQIGKVHGVKAGAIKPRQVVCNLPVGHKFKADDIIAYNSDFFAPDIWDDSQVVFKSGAIRWVAFHETNDSLEDGSAIDMELHTSLATPVTKRHDITASFDKTISDLIKVGDEVEYDTPLCTITEAGVDASDATMASLSTLASPTPKAKTTGHVTAIEVKYLGNKDGMSPTIKRIVNKADAERKELAEGLNNGDAVTGEIKGYYKIEGRSIPRDTVIITVYTEHHENLGVGDKGALGNMLKTVHGRVMKGVNETASGLPIAMIFGFRGVQDRVVNSPMIVGTALTNLWLLSNKVYEMYKEG